MTKMIEMIEMIGVEETMTTMQVQLGEVDLKVPVTTGVMTITRMLIRVQITGVTQVTPVILSINNKLMIMLGTTLQIPVMTTIQVAGNEKNIIYSGSCDI